MHLYFVIAIFCFTWVLLSLLLAYDISNPLKTKPIIIKRSKTHFKLGMGTAVVYSLLGFAILIRYWVEYGG